MAVIPELHIKPVGRPPRSTIAERADVFRLADQGFSQRAIAERVYGDRRFQLRVLRLLRRRRTWEDADAETRRRCEEQLEELAALDLVDDVARARSQQVLDNLDDVTPLAELYARWASGTMPRRSTSCGRGRVRRVDRHRGPP